MNIIMDKQKEFPYLPALRMMQISDSLFPIGAFTLSNGLETLVEEKRICKGTDLEEYLDTYIALLPYQDLGTMMLAYENIGNADFLIKLDAVSMAFKDPREVREGCMKLCSRFLKLWKQVHIYQSLEKYAQFIQEKKCQGNHAVAVGLYAKEIGLEKQKAGLIYAYSLVNMAVTTVVKLVPLSQTEGQKILFHAAEKLYDCAETASGLCLEDLGIGGTELSIAAMRHETLYSRLYMS